MDESDEELVRQTKEEEEEEGGGGRHGFRFLTPLRVSTCEVLRASHRFRFLTNAQ